MKFTKFSNKDENVMRDFPEFMKNPSNAIDSKSQSKGIEGYVFDGLDGSQMVFWTCYKNGKLSEHIHDYDEYMIVVQGKYTIIVNDEETPVTSAQEYSIPKGLVHADEFIAGTRTVHAFGGERAKKASDTE